MDASQLVFCIPLAGIAFAAYNVYLAHARKIAEINARTGTVERTNANTPAVATEIAALRAEVERLRDTSTKFDMSFDAGLTRLEERVARVEAERMAAVTSGAAAMPVPGVNGAGVYGREEEREVVRVGAR